MLQDKIDHTLLAANATKKEVEKLCIEAKKYGFFSVCVQPDYVAYAKKKLYDSKVKVTTVVGFPLGANQTEIKVYEAKLAVEEGADEVDMVQNISRAKDGDFAYIEKEIRKVKEALPKEIVVKVILETSLLTKEEIVKSSKAALAAGADFIKTSTGFSTGGAKVEDILLMRESVGEKMKIKASGGIRDLDTALAMIQAGASRLGLSRSVSIIEEMEEKDEI